MCAHFDAKWKSVIRMSTWTLSCISKFVNWYSLTPKDVSPSATSNEIHKYKFQLMGNDVIPFWRCGWNGRYCLIKNVLKQVHIWVVLKGVTVIISPQFISVDDDVRYNLKDIWSKMLENFNSVSSFLQCFKSKWCSWWWWS